MDFYELASNSDIFPSNGFFIKTLRLQNHKSLPQDKTCSHKSVSPNICSILYPTNRGVRT